MDPLVFKIILIISLIIFVGLGVFLFLQLPIGEQKKKIKQWLVFAVAEAEKALGSKTGQLKLRAVYDAFIGQFKIAAIFISFDRFSKWVDAALDTMYDWMMESEEVRNYVENNAPVTEIKGFIEETTEQDSDKEENL